jgi:uncharacterized protein (DUF488 family)
MNAGTEAVVTIFTVGHSNHAEERFLALLGGQGIDRLVDIRRFPSSRKYPHFKRDHLRTSLAAKQIRYEWIEELGGRRKAVTKGASPNQGLRNESFRNYADYMLTPQFRQGIDKLLADSAERTTAIMCAEGLWWECHRRLVSDYLVANGCRVEHIFSNGQTKPHVLTPETRSVDGRISYPGEKTLFETDEPDS